MKNENGLTMEVVTIDKAKAKALLSGHRNYRRPNPSRIDAYARVMSSGKWMLSILLFDADGELIDGQNRLAAVAKSGKSITFVCIHGWPKGGVIAVDNGQNRSRAQVGAAERGVKNGNRIMSLVVAMDNPKRWTTLLNIEALDAYDRNGQIAEAVNDALKRPVNAAVHCVAFARAIMKHPDKKEQILTAARKLSAMDFSEPNMYGLRLYFSWAITRGFAKGGGEARWETYLRGARALQAYLNNETIDKLYRPASDPFAA